MACSVLRSDEYAYAPGHLSEACQKQGQSVSKNDNVVCKSNAGNCTEVNGLTVQFYGTEPDTEAGSTDEPTLSQEVEEPGQQDLILGEKSDTTHESDVSEDVDNAPVSDEVTIHTIHRDIEQSQSSEDESEMDVDTCSNDDPTYKPDCDDTEGSDNEFTESVAGEAGDDCDDDDDFVNESEDKSRHVPEQSDFTEASADGRRPLKRKRLEEFGSQHPVPEGLLNRGLDRVQVQCVSFSYSGKRDYSKMHCCYFCEKKLMKMARHLTICHSEEAEVKRIPSLPPPGTVLDMDEVERIKNERVIALDYLRNLGNFNHNVNVIAKGEGTLIVGKRNNHTSPKDYLPCSSCFAFFLKKELWRHSKDCKLRKGTAEDRDESLAAEHNLVTCKLLLYGAGGSVLDGSLGVDYIKYVVNSLIKDEVSSTITTDNILMEFGKIQFEKLGKQRASDVRAKLRILGRIKLELRKLVKNNNDNYEQLLAPEHFNECVSAVKQISIVSKDQRRLCGTKRLEKPYLALKAGQLLKKLAILKKGKSIKKKDLAMAEDADHFIERYMEKWSDKVGGIARQSISKRKYNKKIVLLMTENQVKLSNELDKSVKDNVAALTSKVDKHTWQTLANSLLARITVFNKRREDEPSKMLLGSLKWIEDPPGHIKEIENALTKVEKHLLSRLHLTVVLDKQNRKVPVLLTTEMHEALNVLTSTRVKAGIPDSNPYVFPEEHEEHMRGWDCVREAAQKCGLKNPDLLTSTLLRNYMATVAQVLNLSDTDIGELVRHIGHELPVHHHRFDRLQEDVIELSKITKLLLLPDGGNASQFCGKNLDDIQVNDLFDEEEETEDDITDSALTQVLRGVSSGCNYRKVSRRTKTTQKKVNKKKVWTIEEKKLLMPLVANSVRTGRPPVKELVLKLKKDTPLDHLPWMKIKHQVWAMTQSKIRRKRKQ